MCPFCGNDAENFQLGREDLIMPDRMYCSECGYKFLDEEEVEALSEVNIYAGFDSNIPAEYEHDFEDNWPY